MSEYWAVSTLALSRTDNTYSHFPFGLQQYILSWLVLCNISFINSRRAHIMYIGILENGHICNVLNCSILLVYFTSLIAAWRISIYCDILCLLTWSMALVERTVEHDANPQPPHTHPHTKTYTNTYIFIFIKCSDVDMETFK